MIYGNLPEDLGLIDVDNKEMMFWQYCSISLANSSELYIPDNLIWTYDIILASLYNFNKTSKIDQQLNHYYHNIYLTVKTLYVTENYIGNRFGWHTDGFGTDDINYIWYDRVPTEFIHGKFHLTDDCDKSMSEMEEIAQIQDKIHYPNRHLLKLDSSVIHRCNPVFNEGIRSFVKVSYSKDIYNLEGNSRNPKLKTNWTMLPREVNRNHPSKKV
jgi:hypothetical protein